MDLFKDKSASESDDTTDSEESVYSGLEEEPDTSDDEGEEDENDSDDNEKNNESDDDNYGDKVNKEIDDSNSDDVDINEEDEKTVNVTAKNKQNRENDIKTTSQTVVDEYYEDSSDEEDIRNTVGNIPMEWYRDYPHIGYDVEGRKLIKPKKGDELDEFLQRMDNPDYWRTVTNKMTGQNVKLTKEDLNLIENLMLHRTPGGSQETYEPWVDFFTNEVMIHPVTNRPEHKRSFIPSKWEKLKVGQMVHAIKMGWMKRSTDKKDKKDEETKYYMLWKDDEESEVTKRYRAHIPAPKPALPGHAESYNPPPEYLFTKEEEEKWLSQDPEERRMNFIPQKYSSLRLVPAYPRFVNERFERCLDLYLCPRQQKTRMNINPEDLIPKLPKPKDLQPFPTQQAIIYKGHTDIIRCISADPTGQWLVSGCDDHTVKFWEVSTGRCMKTLKVTGTPRSIAWNPNPGICLVLVAIDQTLTLLNPGLGDKVIVSNTDTMLQSFEPNESEPGKMSPINWTVCEDDEYDQGYRFTLIHPKEISQVSWHGKGDYFSSVMPKGDSKSVLIHQLSKRRSQNPFSKSKGLVQCVYFHPVRPFLFVATQRYVRVYNLLKQELTKKLMTNCRWVSSMAVHSGGDNLVIGSYDCKLSWFDLDLSTKPYQTLRHHKKAIRQVSFHKRYPLFASASDDGTVIVCHGMVYNDLLQNPLIVPVKVLHGHKVTKGLGVIDCVFHPTQPWVFSSGADGTIRLYT